MMTNKTTLFRCLIVSITCLFAFTLTACHRTPQTPSLDPHPLTPYEKILVSHIELAGAQVIKQGEVIQIVMPASTFFYTTTWKFRHRKLTTVHRIASLVKSYTARYRHPKIRVAGYTDTLFSQAARLTISHHMATTVAAQLWNKGIRRNWIQIKGYGSKDPIASNQTSDGAAMNRRVVIRIN